MCYSTYNTITVNDDVAPTWDQAPGELDEEFDCDSENDGPTAPTATDNCPDNMVTVTIISDVTTPDPPICNDQYVRVVTYIATDECGNESEPYTVTLTVNDNSAGPMWDQMPGDLDVTYTCDADVVIPPAPTA